MTLAIDIGNTSAKLALYRGEELLKFMRLTDSWIDTLTRLSTEFGHIRHALISNVASEQHELMEVLQKMEITPHNLTWETPEAHSLLYNIPQGLGADRLAADIGAMTLSEGHPILVVDAGTCLTFDVIDAKATYVGGSISPGIELRLKAMHDHTAALPLFTAQGKAPIVGTDLEGAMRGGCLNGLRWEIEGYTRHLQSHGYPNLKVYYTGGNDLQLANDVDQCVTHDPMLVMKGLRHVFKL